MADVSVTINPPNSTSVTIGNAVSAHGATHAPGSSDSLENYYYPRTNPSGYATSGDFATTNYVGEVSGYLYSQIAFPSNVVFTTGGQTIGGAKNFSTRPTVNGTGVLLSGEASVGDTGYLTGYVQKIETGNFVISSQTGNFYPLSNPSGYITGVDLSAYQTIASSTGISGYLQEQISSNGSNISAINNASGAFLTTGAGDVRYVTGNVVRPNETGSFLIVESDPVFAASAAYAINSTLTGQWSVSYSDSITGINVSGISSKTITLYKRDGSTLTASFSDIEGTGGGGTDYFLTGVSFNSADGNLSLYINDGSIVTESLDGRYVTGSVVRPSDTGSFVIVGDLTVYQTVSASTGISGYLQSQISSINSSTGQFVTGSVVRPSETGNFITTYQTGVFVPYTGAIADLNLGENSLLAHGVSGDASHGLNIGSNNGTTCAVFGVGGGANSTFYGGLKADYSTASKVAVFDSSKNLISSNVSSGELNYLTGVSSPIQTQINSININTGAFLTTGSADSRYYPLSSNPSSYLVAADISSLASTGYVTGVSGYLQDQISTLNSLSGQLTTGYNSSITGIAVDGTSSKTITLFQQNGSTLTANFSDLQGTGGSASSDNSVLLTGDQNISGVKNFYSRPTVDGVGVLLSGEASSSPSISEWNFLSSTTISNNSSVTVSLTGDYQRYLVRMKNICGTNAGYELRARCSSDGGSTFISGASDYDYGHGIINSYLPTQAAASYMVVSPLLPAKPSGGACGEIVWDAVGDSGKKPSCRWNLSHETWNSNHISLYLGASLVNKTTGINAMQFYVSLGNLSGGSLNVFGSNY